MIKLTIGGKKEGPSHKFVEDMYTRHHTNPFNDREFIMPHDKGHAFFHVSTMGHDTAHVHDFRTHPQRSGIGAAALKELTGHADRHGVKLHLTPEGYGDTPTHVLKKFYKKHGFKMKNGDMTREPQKPINEDAPTMSVGSAGNMIAGIGIGPQGEPGRKSTLMPLARRRLDVMNRVKKSAQKKADEQEKKWPDLD